LGRVLRRYCVTSPADGSLVRGTHTRVWVPVVSQAGHGIVLLLPLPMTEGRGPAARSGRQPDSGQDFPEHGHGERQIEANHPLQQV
jgi:hypothetical protein